MALTAGRSWRAMGTESRALLADPSTFEAGTTLEATRTGFAIGHGGEFDYQRGPGNSITGFEQRRQFRNVSNVNVGLFGQQAGWARSSTAAGWRIRRDQVQ